MGWNPFAWLSGEEEEESPPEPLVLGAELHCPYGLSNSYLIVGTDNIDLNSLPEAHVQDCIALENIMPFGNCGLGVPCEEIMDLEERWENPEPQTMFSNGEEVVTTRSTLICKKMGMEIMAVTSGQDGVFAEKWAAYQEQLREFEKDFEEKYPGLLDILKDPYKSLYLDTDMYKTALRFITDYVEKSGGELPLAKLYYIKNAPEKDLPQAESYFIKEYPEKELLKAALVHLLPGIDPAKQESFLSVLEERGVATNMYDVPGWDAHILNAQMLEMLRADCAHTAELIEKEGFYRWSEEHKQTLRTVADSITDFTYSLAIYYSIIASQNQMRKRNNWMQKGANKLKNALKKAFSGENKGGSEAIYNVSELSNEQIEALIKYTGDDYANINNSLRGVETLTSENRTTVEAMKSALDNSALPQDMTLYRGTSTEALGSLQNLSVDELVGKTYTEQGFMSTSTSNVVAEGFSGNMQMTIEASKGAQALDISSISQYTTEAEVLFNTGQEMLITSAEVKNGILYITVIIE